MAALNPKKPVVAVVGAGMAGLAAAFELSKACDVVVYEAASGPGGRAHCNGEVTFSYAGRDWHFRLEHGVHGVWRQYRNLRRILGEIGKSKELEDVGGQEFVAPTIDGDLGAWDFASKVRASPLPSAVANLQMFTAGDFAIQAVRDKPSRWLPAASELTHAFAFDGIDDVARYDDISVADYIKDWPAYLQRLTGAITHSAFFREPEHVSLAAYMTGLQGYFISDKLDTAFGVLRQNSDDDLFGPMCAAIRERGGDIRFEEPVTGVEFASGRITISSQTKNKQRRSKRVDGLVLALDPPGFAKLVSDGPIAEAIGDAVIPEGIPSAVVRLWFRRAPSPGRPKTGVFAGAAADNFFWLDQLQRDFGRWRKHVGGSVLECHLYGNRAIEAAEVSDAVLITRTTALAERSWPLIADSMVHGHVQRNAPTHVAFGPGVMARLPKVVTSIPNVALAGDWIACDTPILYLERATITGMQAAAALATHLGLDRSALATPLPPHPPAKSIAAFRRVFRSLRKLGALPTLR